MQYAEENTEVRVTLPQFFADKLSAILHATLCLHRGYNPFTIYREKLNAKASLAHKQFEQRQEARLTQDVASDDALKEYKVMSLDSLAALIASQESLVSSLEESVENADGEQLFGNTPKPHVSSTGSVTCAGPANWQNTCSRKTR